jgi:hypothetical protein
MRYIWVEDNVVLVILVHFQVRMGPGDHAEIFVLLQDNA